MNKFFIGGLIAIASFAAHADELVLTPGAGKGGVEQVSIDFVTNGDAVAFQFNIRLPKGVDASQVDLKSCVADLPKSHRGQCSVAKGQVIGLVANDDNSPFSAGVVPVGKISIKAADRASFNRRGGGMEVAKFLVSDKDANPISSVAKFAEE